MTFSGEAVDAEGNKADAHPSVVLQHRGPCLQVAIKLHPDIEQQLTSQAAEVPPPVTGWALLDTGASTTCLDDQVAEQLSLPVIGTASIGTASHASSRRNIYPVAIEIAGLQTHIIAKAVGVELSSQGLLALIGRDVLSACTLFYNGLSGEITLSR
jgi:predicted aspartyl protease